MSAWQRSASAKAGEAVRNVSPLAAPRRAVGCERVQLLRCRSSQSFHSATAIVLHGINPPAFRIVPSLSRLGHDFCLGRTTEAFFIRESKSFPGVPRLEKCHRGVRAGNNRAGIYKILSYPAHFCVILLSGRLGVPNSLERTDAASRLSASTMAFIFPMDSQLQPISRRLQVFAP